ncbi:P1 family peptidase [Nitratireductor sp. ZSWI3]|uniref:DmpA family aminopeptidase n=1 Tax=Nitratireductor sp. ZSWI3 TaxID=2966359 RepID=UPI00214F9B1B|nr:P1 family peptidase [Nitratireductor sp. ZSWI3]MCR4267605.1 P1 family peptidase [Nitratireductor sp. ZSWI3]
MNQKQTSRKPRARELGLRLPGTPGAHNAITDVPGVMVGYETLNSHREPGLQTGPLPVQTGVTAILPTGLEPSPRPVWAGQSTLNGNGEMTGTHWIHDGGYFVGPILLTNTHSVGAVHHGATRWMLEQYGEAWQKTHLWAMPVVTETYDGVLNDINGQHVRPEHALAAIRSASSGAVAEGNVGGGAGMICYEFKGGTGTASRRLDIAGATYHVGALVQANHGVRPWLNVLGVPVGLSMTEDRIPGLSHERGSIICVIGTDLPLLPTQLQKLARRATIGIGRGGTPGGNNSGDMFLAFSTANDMDLPQLSGPWRRMTCLNDELLDPVYLAAVEAVEEAVLNAMLAAEDTPTARPSGAICRAIDGARLVSLVERADRGNVDPADSP